MSPLPPRAVSGGGRSPFIYRPMGSGGASSSRLNSQTGAGQRYLQNISAMGHGGSSGGGITCVTIAEADGYKTPS